MAEAWEKKALEIGESLRAASREHSELAPLYTSWVNFARKRHLPRQIKTLEHRSITFLRPEQ